MLSHHASARCRQRGIRSEVVGVLLEFGHRRHRHGAEVCFMDRAARARVCTALGRRAYARIADRLGTYLVIGEDGGVVTAAHRLRRLKFS